MCDPQSAVGGPKVAATIRTLHFRSLADGVGWMGGGILLGGGVGFLETGNEIRLATLGGEIASLELGTKLWDTERRVILGGWNGIHVHHGLFVLSSFLLGRDLLLMLIVLLERFLGGGVVFLVVHVLGRFGGFGGFEIELDDLARRDGGKHRIHKLEGRLDHRLDGGRVAGDLGGDEGGGRDEDRDGRVLDDKVEFGRVWVDGDGPKPL